MANKLRMKLQTRSKDRYEYGKKKGKLHNGSLHRLVSGSDVSSEKVFRQRVVSDTTDTALCLLVDCSGSMSGKKFDMACAGAGALSEALKPLNIAHSIYGFTNTVTVEDPIIWLFSEFGERVTQPELLKRFEKVSGGLWQNSDGDAIAYATARLTQRKEHRKVLLVLSDGSPSGRDHAGDVEAYTLQTVKQAEKMGIDVYGIGIDDSNVTRFYKKNVVVKDLHNLAPTILSIIDRSI
jgi:cobaltochelatase CobT